MKPFVLLTYLGTAILIICFLNIHIQTSSDTVNAVWNFIYQPNAKYMSLVLMSYPGIIFLLISNISRFKFRFIAFIVGLSLLCLVLLRFYPDFESMQRETYINPQTLFVLTVILMTVLRIIEYKSFRNKPGE